MYCSNEPFRLMQQEGCLRKNSPDLHFHGAQVTGVSIHFISALRLNVLIFTDKQHVPMKQPIPTCAKNMHTNTTASGVSVITWGSMCTLIATGYLRRQVSTLNTFLTETRLDRFLVSSFICVLIYNTVQNWYRKSEWQIHYLLFTFRHKTHKEIISVNLMYPKLSYSWFI